MERIDLVTPDQSYSGTSDYRVVSIALVWESPEGSFIHVGLQGTNGLRRSFTYEGAEARTLMLALNKADLSVKSLHRRVLEKLKADGKLVGTVSGAPE